MYVISPQRPRRGGLRPGWLLRALLMLLLVGIMSVPAQGQDTTDPYVTRVHMGSAPQQGDTYSLSNVIRVVVWLNEPIQVSGAPILELAVGTGVRRMIYDACYGCTGLTTLDFEYTVQPDDYDPDGVGFALDPVKLNGGRITDLAGNDATLTFGPRHAFYFHKVDGSMDLAPVVQRLTIDSYPVADNTYMKDERLTFSVSFDENVTVTGSPTLALQFGNATRFATLDESWGRFETTLVAFEYTVGVHDRAPDGISIATDALHLNGGSIRDVTGNDALTSLQSHAVTNHLAHKVNGSAARRPVVVEQYWGGSRGGSSGSVDTYGLGNTIGVYIGYNRPVTVTGVPALALTIGTETRFALFEWLGHEDTTLYFTYRVQDDDYDPDGVSMGADALRPGGARIRAPDGVDADLSLARVDFRDDPGHKVDGSLDFVPTIESIGVSSDPQRADTYLLGNSIEVRVDFSEDVLPDVPYDAPPTLTMTIGRQPRTATYYAWNSRASLFFNYRVQASDKDETGIGFPADTMQINGADIRDITGNEADLRHAAVPDDPEHRVDGRRHRTLSVTNVDIESRPQCGDTYSVGEVIAIIVSFDQHIARFDAHEVYPHVELRIGSAVRRAEFEPLSLPRGRGYHYGFYYTVVAADQDPNGVSIAEDALRMVATDGAGEAVDVSLRGHVVPDAPGHKVDGSAKCP